MTPAIGPVLPFTAKFATPRILALVLLVLGPAWVPAADPATLTVSRQPLHGSRISPLLFGNFIELLDDLVPGLWAEMLNDRSFEGVVPRARWCYYTGEPNFCDREWERSGSWFYETTGAFNGTRCARIAANLQGTAALAQSGLAVRKSATYLFSGHLRSDAPELRATVVLKTMLPNGDWFELASAQLPKLTDQWRKYAVRMVSVGESEQVVFELRAAGQGHLWADKLSLMSAENLNGWRRDTVEAVKAARPGILRWGGSAIDPGGYRWKEGIGDRDARVPFPNKYWGRIDSNDVGLDEFCQFCRLTGCEPLICVSFADGVQSAADLVEYCNGSASTTWGARRAANGHPEPYGVKYWQLGNEISGDDEGYLSRCRDFCEGIKRADPRAVILASFPTQKLLEQTGRQIDYIGPHHYTPDFAGCDRDFNQLAVLLQKTAGCGHIRMAVTEWNISASGWGLMRGKLMTLETALLNAKYLNLLMRHSDKADIACRSNLANSMGSGIIQTGPAGLYKHPSYYAMKLYADHQKPIPLATIKAPAPLDVVACAAEDRRLVTVFVVNPEGKAVAVRFHGSESDSRLQVAGGEVLMDTLDGRQPDVMNHWRAPDRIRTIPLGTAENGAVLPPLSAAAVELRFE